jgi:small subunit ribosomal protein S8e
VLFFDLRVIIKFINVCCFVGGMAISQARSKRKVSGSRYIDYRKKKAYELGRDPTYTKVGERQIKVIRGMGGNYRTILLSEEVVNLFDPKNKKCKKVKLKTVKENKANRDFVRRNILTKGTIVETEAGLAKITNRPGQEGVINAVLIENK